MVRVGPFSADDRRPLSRPTCPSQKQLAIMARQPGADFATPAERCEDAPDGYVDCGRRSDARRAAFHLCAAPDTVGAHREGRGGRLRDHPGRRSSAQHCAVYQLFYLATVRGRVRNQLKFLDASGRGQSARPRAAPRSRATPRRSRRTREVVELRISEAVLKEVPKLERFQSFLRARRRGRSAAGADRHRHRHDHHLPEHHRVGFERSEADGRRHLAGDDRDGARPGHRDPAAVRERLAGLAVASRSCRCSTNRAPACWPSAWRRKAQCLRSMLHRRRTPSHDMRELGGPVVDWIFVACVLMWAIVIERYLVLHAASCRARSSGCCDRLAAHGRITRAGARTRSARAMISRLNAG